MPEEPTPQTINYEHAVRARLQHIVDTKRRDNAESRGRLEQFASAWNTLGKSLGEDIETEFARVALEEQAIEHARGLLQKNSCVPMQENAFVIAGKVIDKDSQVGLPGLLLTIVRARDRAQTPLTEPQYTDSFGNFTATILLDNADYKNWGEQVLTFLIFSAPEALVDKQNKSLSIQPGEVEEVILTIRCGTDVADRLEGGKAVRDSVEKDAEAVRLRLANMKVAHTALNRLAEVSLADLQTLREDISYNPPELLPRTHEVIESAPEAAEEAVNWPEVENVGVAPTETPVDMAAPEAQPVAEPESPLPPIALEAITGIGRGLAERLRAAGIPDVQAFLDTAEDTLRAVLRNRSINISEMKAESAALLEKAREAARGNDKE